MDVLRRLERVGVPAGPINNVSEALNDEQSIFRKMVLKDGENYYLNSPMKFNNLTLAENPSAANLGADTSLIRKRVQDKSFWNDRT